MSDEESTACEALAERLGYLPLALEQAAAYIHAQGPGFGCRDYLRLSAEAERELLSVTVHGTTDYPSSVFLTWRTSVNRLPAGARVMLRIAAFLAPTEIPLALFVNSAGGLNALEGDFPTSPRQECESSPECCMRAWRQALAEYSLLTVTSGESFLVHGLVQAVERHQLEFPTQTRWLTAAIDAFVHYAPGDAYEFENWQRWRQLVSHAEALRVHAEQAGLIIDTALLKGLCEFHRRQGAWTAALPLALQMLAQDERVFGTDDPATLWSLNAVALLRGHLGDYREAESLCRRALIERERVLGSDHPDTLWSGTNLGFILARQGDFASAEQLHHRVLDARERTLGPEHPDTLASLNQLAGVLANQGYYDNAQTLAHRGFLLRERVLGPDHPDTLTSMSTLGTVLFHAGDDRNAEGWLRRALDAQERVLGPEHPFTLLTVSVLAALVEKQGNRAAAEALFRRALSYEMKLGPGRPVSSEPLVSSLIPIPAVLTGWGPIPSSGNREVAEAIYRTFTADGRIPSPVAKHAPGHQVS